MSITLKKLLEDNKVFPASAKMNDIDNQWLEPASYDKKMVKAMTGDTELKYDQEKIEDESDNFKAQDKLKKNTKAPLREDGQAIAGSTNDALYEAYMNETYDLLDEITDILEDEDSIKDYAWQGAAENLKRVRDHFLVCGVNESEDFLEESFKSGKIKLHDGSTFSLSKEDAKKLNFAISNTKEKEKLVSEITKNKKELKEFLQFASSLAEDYSGTIDNLLEQIDDLGPILSEELTESELWKRVKQGVKQGAAKGGYRGAKVGAVGGAVVGGATGALAGAAHGAAYGGLGPVTGAAKYGAGGAALGAVGGAGVGAATGAAVGGAAGGVKSLLKRKKKPINESKTVAKFIINGAKIGKDIGAVGGAVSGGLIGGTLGITHAGYRGTKKAADIFKSIKEKKKEAAGNIKEDQEDEKKSILGTSAPAMDSDPNQNKKKTVKKEDLLENSRISDHKFADSIGGDASNYRNPLVRRDSLPTEKAKSLPYYIITPHDVVGKAPRKEGDIFTVKADKNMTVKLQLIKIVDNRFYGKKPDNLVKEDLSKNATAGDYIKDFEDSDDSRFKGDSKEKRKQRALAAFYSSKKKNVNETSEEKLNKYLNKAITDHGMTNFAKNSTSGKEKEYWDRKTKNRKKGISRAIDQLDKKNIKETEGYQLWPGQKKKKFFQEPKDKDGKTETQKWLEKKKQEKEISAEKNK